MGYYWLTLNLFGAALTAIDKLLAQKHRWRIPEAALFAAAILGGSLGVLVCMLLTRHKIRKPLFILGIPALFLIQFLLLLDMQ